jgi:N-acetylglucosamine-6-phosphate deacetylase
MPDVSFELITDDTHLHTNAVSVQKNEKITQSLLL